MKFANCHSLNYSSSQVLEFIAIPLLKVAVDLEQQKSFGFGAFEKQFAFGQLKNKDARGIDAETQIHRSPVR